MYYTPRWVPYAKRDLTAGNLLLGESIRSDALLLQDLARVIAIPLRDGCAVMGVIGRRLQAQVLSD